MKNKSKCTFFSGKFPIIDNDQEDETAKDDSDACPMEDKNLLRVLSDIQEVTEETSSTVVPKEVSSSDSTKSSMGMIRLFSLNFIIRTKKSFLFQISVSI